MTWRSRDFITTSRNESDGTSTTPRDFTTCCPCSECPRGDGDCMFSFSCSFRCSLTCFSAVSVLGVVFKQGVMEFSISGISMIRGSGERGGEGTTRVRTLSSVGVLLCTFNVADPSFKKSALNSYEGKQEDVATEAFAFVLMRRPGQNPSTLSSTPRVLQWSSPGCPIVSSGASSPKRSCRCSCQYFLSYVI